MSDVLTRHIADRVIPEFITASAPKFLEFMEAYYAFMESYEVEFRTVKDVDYMPEQLLGFLKSELAARWPSALVDDRKLITLVNYIYKTKGTVDTIELLFRIFYNEIVTVSSPSKSILRASDGVWQQRSFITVEKTFGEVPTGVQGVQLKIENTKGTFYVDITSIEEITSTTCRIFFKRFRYFEIEPNQKIDLVSGDTLLYRGTLRKSPAKLVIGDSGKFWKVGQLLSIGGTDKNTLAVVRATNPDSSLKTIEIVDFGFVHSENEVIVAYPLPGQPPNAAVVLEVETVAYDSVTGTFTNNYTLTLTENAGLGVVDSGAIIGSVTDETAYFLQNYTDGFYTGRIVNSWGTSAGGTQGGVVFESDFTYEDWVDSRTTLSYTFDWVAHEPGYFETSTGQISNSNIRLQDNFFYQLFSYVITSSIYIDDFRPILNLVHPAGLKAFGNLMLDADFDLSYATYRRLSRNNIFLDDQLIATEESFKLISKNVEGDDVGNTETIDLSINKTVFETVSVADGAAVVTEEAYFASDYAPVDYVITDMELTIG